MKEAKPATASRRCLAPTEPAYAAALTMPRCQLTTGVRGPSILHEATIDGQPFVNKWHCRIPRGLAGFSHQADWEVRDPGALPSTQRSRAVR